ncbi:MAG: Ig-like domain-containing protein [Actinomycetota bacterium]
MRRVFEMLRGNVAPPVRRPIGRLTLVVLIVATSAGFAMPADAATQVGFKAHSFSGFGAESSGGAITGEKPESKLWFHDGQWWAAMVSPTNAGAHTIWRLGQSAWTNTGVVIDTRPATKEDVLSQGTTLYVTSRASNSQGGNKLRRFTYAGGTYQLDGGFPVNLPGSGEETLTLARDSTGRLWVTYEASTRVYVAHSTTSDTAWSSPFVLPVTGATGTSSDDISSVIAFTDDAGPAIGVLWSNQKKSTDYFAVHRDSAPTSTWSVEIALTGTKEADDHINLKTSGGRVYAAVKTEASTSSASRIRLLVRSESGTWGRHHVATVAEANTRPITTLFIDPVQNLVYVFMTIGEGATADGISYKVSPINNIAFPSQATVFIRGPNAEKINNATSSKENGNAASGLVILASDGANYWWNRIGGGAPPANTPPTANATSAGTAQATPVGVTLTATDPENCELGFSIVQQPAHGSLGSLGAQTCTVGSPNTDRANVTYTPAAGFSGSDSFTFRANDGTANSNTATVSITVAAGNAPPQAAAVSKSGPPDQPVDVGLSGTDLETCELTFGIVSGPAHGALSGIAGAPCDGGSPNADSASVVYTPAPGFTGADSFTYAVTDGEGASANGVVSLTIGSPPAGIAFRSASSAANVPSTTLTIPSPAGVAADDVLVAAIDVRGNPTLTPPAGWTLVRLDISGFVMRQAVYVRVAGSNVPPSYTWTLSSIQSAAGGIAAYSGVDTASPILTHAGQISTTSGTNQIVAPSITTTVNGAMILGIFGVANNTSVTAPAGMTERFDMVSNAGTYPVVSSCAQMIQSAAGATGNKTAISGTNGWNIGQLIALRPRVA